MKSPLPYVNRLIRWMDIQLVRASTLERKLESEAFTSQLAASPTARSRILVLADLLAPRQPIGFEKVRIGGVADGAYVCLNDFKGVSRAFSLGIDENVDWDLEIATKGIIVHQFDHTVEGPPIAHDNFRFERKKVVPVLGADDGEASLSSILERYKEASEDRVILKIDIENDEWPVFEATPLSVLMQFSQIVCEFHGFNSVLTDSWYNRALSVLTKLRSAFEVIHVHGNNYRPWVVIGNVPFPEVLEVTLVNNERCSFQWSEAIFPTSMDAQNSPRMPDMFLGRFQFSEPPHGSRAGGSSSSSDSESRNFGAAAMNEIQV